MGVKKGDKGVGRVRAILSLEPTEQELSTPKFFQLKVVLRSFLEQMKDPKTPDKLLTPLLFKKRTATLPGPFK